MKVIDRTKAVTQHFFREIILEIVNKNMKKKQSEKHKNSFIFLLISVASWCSMCFCLVLCVCFLFRSFCHGALKLDISTLFTTFFLWVLSIIFYISVMEVNIHNFFVMNPTVEYICKFKAEKHNVKDIMNWLICVGLPK